MLERLAFGDVPAKHHVALRDESGRLRYEECLTRNGFDGPYSILYHEDRPQALRAIGAPVFEPLEAGRSAPRNGSDAQAGELLRRHYRTLALASLPLLESAREGSPSGRVPLLYNADLVLSCYLPTASDTSYRVNAAADELLFVLQGRATLRSLLGDLDFIAGDYVLVPKGLLHRFVPGGSAPLHCLSMQFYAGVGVPARFRNPVGQLRMDAPYSHRDFKRPRFIGPTDEGLREVWVKSAEQSQKYIYPHNPLDVVGWDGTLYPWAFPILNFQPRVSSVHLPPTWHGTFEGKGALVCSFVPRPLDFHPDAVPCPYAHSSADVDEVLFYVDGEFSSRVGVERGSLTLHPGGLPHGPHPGRYEASVGARHTEEIAVMLDCTSRLTPTLQAASIEDEAYEPSFGGPSDL